MTQRRAGDQILASVIDTIADHGFDGLSIRAVAAHAGVSPGAVQHHFPTRTEMLGAAMDAVAAGVEDMYSPIEQITDAVERLYALADALIPGADSKVTRIWLAFAARAAVDEQIRKQYTTLWARVRTKLGIFFAAAGSDSQTVAMDSAELLALLDGLALSIVSEEGALDSTLARAIAHRRIAAFIGDARHSTGPSPRSH